MRFRIEQHLAAPVERFEEALLDPAWYEAVTASKAVWAPELLEVTDAESPVVGLRVRYRFRGTLNPAASKVVNPAKLSWVEVSTLDRGSHTIDLRVEPDSYADRLRFTGTVALRAEDEPAGSGGTAEPAGSGGTAEPAGSGGTGPSTLRVLEGDVRVKVLLVSGAVEGAVVSGLRDHAAVEEGVFAAFVASAR